LKYAKSAKGGQSGLFSPNSLRTSVLSTLNFTGKIYGVTLALRKTIHLPSFQKQTQIIYVEMNFEKEED
jgi:hypothetical protein